MRHVALGLAMLASGTPAMAAPQAAPGFCGQLARVIEAVQQGDLASLDRDTPSLSFGGAHYCRAMGTGWWCHRTLAPDGLSRVELVTKIAGCLPEVKPVPASYSFATVFEIGGLHISVEETGGPRAHVGRIVSLAVRPAA